MKTLFLSCLVFASFTTMAQEISARSNEIPLDLSRKGEVQNGTVPRIEWFNPENDTTDIKAGVINVRFEVMSKQALKYVYLFIRDKETKELKSSTPLPISAKERLSLKIEKLITFSAGTTELEILAENETGFKCISRREVRVAK
jgi:hypothetical protein